MTDGKPDKRARHRNSESKFASPEDNVGIGYYIDGEQVSPDEFSRRVAEDADRIRTERAAAEKSDEEFGQ